MRYLIGLLVTIAVIIFVIIRLLSGGSSTPSLQTPELASLANTDSSVRLIITNAVQASENHREIQITVSRDATNFVLYKGYDGAVVTTKSYGMNEAAYADFLRGLDLSGRYTKGNDDAKLKDERGYCGLGDRYVYEIIDGNGDVKQHYWSTSCGPKTFKGSASMVLSLFQKQVPDYSQLTAGVDF